MSLGATTYTSVSWTTGDVATETKMDNMVANDQAYDAHAAQGYLSNNNVGFHQKDSGGTNREILNVDGSDVLHLGDPNLTMALDSDWDGWITAQNTWTYASATTFTISGVDVTSKLQPGTKIKLTQSTGGTKYWYVASSSFSTNTTVTIIETTDYTLNNEAISSPYYSHADRPQGFPDWFSYTPTIATNSSMTFTSVTIALAKYQVSGRRLTVLLNVLGTTGGTLNTSIYASVPVAANPNTNALYGGGALLFDAGNESGFYTYSTSSGNNLLFRLGDATNFSAGSGRGFKAVAVYPI